MILKPQSITELRSQSTTKVNCSNTSNPNNAFGANCKVNRSKHNLNPAATCICTQCSKPNRLRCQRNGTWTSNSSGYCDKICKICNRTTASVQQAVKCPDVEANKVAYWGETKSCVCKNDCRYVTLRCESDGVWRFGLNKTVDHCDAGNNKINNTEQPLHEATENPINCALLGVASGLGTCAVVLILFLLIQCRRERAVVTPVDEMQIDQGGVDTVNNDMYMPFNESKA